MTEFRQEEYNATVSNLSDNLIGMNAVDILDKKQITKDICINNLNYLMFLNGKRTRGAGVPMVNHNVNTFQKKNLSIQQCLPTRYLYPVIWMRSRDTRS